MRQTAVAVLVLACLMTCPVGRSSAQKKSSSQKEVEECIQTLRTTKNVDVRRDTIKRLEELELLRRGLAKEATPLIAQALKDKDVGVRAAAAAALGVLPYDVPNWVKDLAALINDKEERDVRLSAAESLGRLGKPAAVALDALTALRNKEAARPEDMRDGELLDAVGTAVERIQFAFLTLGPWYYIGPFGNDDNAGFKTVYPPEKEIDLKETYSGKNDTPAKWRQQDFTDGEVNNLALFEDKNNTAAVVYLYREILCDWDTEAVISLGSDDTLTVWLNGEKLLSEEVYRAAAADQNKAALKLRKGKNALLLKICQGDGDWAFYFRVAEVKVPAEAKKPAEGKAPAQDNKPAPVKPGAAMVIEAKDLGVKGKGDKPDPKLAKDRVLAVGRFFARVTEFDEEGKKMKLVVPYRVSVLNPDSVARLGELQQESLNALQIEDAQERAKELLRIQAEVLRTKAALYTLEDHQLDVELPLDEDVQVRLVQPPAKFDEMGRAQKYTPKELEELRAPANLPGFRGASDDLRSKIWIQATVVRKKSDPAAPRLSVILILGNAEE